MYGFFRKIIDDRWQISLLCDHLKNGFFNYSFGRNIPVCRNCFFGRLKVPFDFNFKCSFYKSYFLSLWLQDYPFKSCCLSGIFNNILLRLRFLSSTYLNLPLKLSNVIIPPSLFMSAVGRASLIPFRCRCSWVASRNSLLFPFQFFYHVRESPWCLSSCRCLF